MVYQIEAADQKIRRNWLIITILIFLGTPIFSLALLFFQEYNEEIFIGVISSLISGLIT